MEWNWFSSLLLISPSLSFNFTLHSISTRWMSVKWRKRVAPFTFASFSHFALAAFLAVRFMSRSHYISLIAPSFIRLLHSLNQLIHSLTLISPSFALIVHSFITFIPFSISRSAPFTLPAIHQISSFPARNDEIDWIQCIRFGLRQPLFIQSNQINSLNFI